jgi:hypothetical protein
VAARWDSFAEEEVFDELVLRETIRREELGASMHLLHRSDDVSRRLPARVARCAGCRGGAEGC